MNAHPEKMRLFVAVEASETIKAALASLQFQFPGLKWAQSDTLHLTLRFIGSVAPGKEQEVRQSLRSVTSEPFHLTVACFLEKQGASFGQE